MINKICVPFVLKLLSDCLYLEMFLFMVFREPGGYPQYIITTIRIQLIKSEKTLGGWIEDMLNIFHVHDQN